MVSNADHDGAAVVRLPGLEPLATDAWKVRDIERHKEALLGVGELQQLLVRTTVELALLIDREHVVPTLSQGRADPVAGHVRIEEQAQFAVQSRVTGMTSAWGYLASSSARGCRSSAMKSSISCGKRP